MEEDDKTCEPTAMELAERWRVAGLLLRKIDPDAFEALLHGAEVMICETEDESEKINQVYLSS